MSLKTIPTVQPPSVPFILGTSAYETRRATILEEFAAQVPKELRIHTSIVDAPPKDVTTLPGQCGILSDRDVEITEKFDAVALAEAIALKKLTAVEVATAFAKRAIIAHQLTCCLTEWFMEEAVARAKALDQHLETTGKTVGPLHGVPISIKEMIPLAGHYSSLGFLATRTKDERDCQMIAIVREAGAVFYCKTAQPQAVMHIESTSIHGRVLNPFNINLSAGGSTGGAGALTALRGSVISIGTDVGGSIRGPAASCGVYGYKPTSYTLPMRGFTGSGGFSAELNVLVSAGPICGSLRDMDLFVSVLKAARPHLQDPRLIPIPWTGLNGHVPKPNGAAPLKVGFMMNDGVIHPQPPVLRALKWARAQLANCHGFEVKDFAPYRVEEAICNLRLTYFPDGGRQVKQALRSTGEPMLPLTQWIIKDAEDARQDLDAAGVLQQRVTRDEFRWDFAAHWTEQDVDIVIAPVSVGPAFAHETGFYWNYGAFWNYVDCPSAAVPTPVRSVKKGEEDYGPAEATPLSDKCAHVRRLWEEGDFEGAPVGLQVVARKYHDNDLFAALNQLREPLGI